MSVLNPTRKDLLTDDQGRPYFLWDVELTLDEFRAKLRDGSHAGRAYLVGKLMRQAKPDDVFEFVTLAEIRDLWPDLHRYLGRTREFWTWLLDRWESIELTVEISQGPVRIRVDAPNEILVNKLCTLLGRAEFRDLVDVRALLAAGGDLARALGDAPRKDGGFSPLTLAWVLRGLPVSAMGEEEGTGPADAQELARFRDDLVGRLTDAARPAP